MEKELQKLYKVWDSDPNRGIPGTEPRVDFNDLANAIVSTGPFYCYIVDFTNMSLSHVKPSIQHILGLDPEKIAFKDVLEAIHPDDMDFVVKAEAFLGNFFFKNVEPARVMKYKSSFNFRMRLADGEYALFNHQAMMLTLGPDGGFGKALNIHTRIDHLNPTNNYRMSVICMDDSPSFLNLSLNSDYANMARFSQKEIQIIKNLGDGLDSNAIAEKLFISPHTVKKHRKNILEKSGCKNVAELIKNSAMNGLL